MERQGDLLFVRCEKFPEGADEQKDRIIARGEATGHTHRLGSGKAMLMLLAGIAYIKAETEVQVDHDEHHTITLPPGNYMVKRQREYTPDGWRQVAD